MRRPKRHFTAKKSRINAYPEEALEGIEFIDEHGIIIEKKLRKG